MFDIYDENGTFQRFIKAGVALRGIDGKLFANASAQPVAVLNAHGIYPVNDPGKPSQEWQVVTGMKRTINAETGNSDWSYQVTPLSLNAGKDKLRAKVKANRDAAMFGGYLWQPSDDDTYLVQTDAASRANILEQKSLAESDVAAGVIMPRSFRMANNSAPKFPPSEIVKMANAVARLRSDCMDNQVALETLIDTLSDLDACKAFDCSAGFPSIPVITNTME